MKTLTVDDYHRVRLPDVRPRSKLGYERNADGAIVLTELQPMVEKTRIVKPVLRGDILVLPVEGEVDVAALDREIREERDQANARLLG